MHGDYPASEATKEQAKLQLLRVHVHTLADLTTAEHLITKYMLNQGRPFIRYQNLVCGLVEELTQEIIDKQAAQGNQVAIDRKIEGMADEVYGYDANPEAAVALNERLINQGNEKAVGRKIYGLSGGNYGYEENIQATCDFIEDMATKGNQTAIKRKIDGYTYGLYGYQEHPILAVNLIEHWVEQGSKRAIRWKVKGLANGMYGYKENLIEAVNLNEALIEQGDGKAIGKKIFGLAHGCYGYEKDLVTAIALNEKLIEQGNEEAIIRKIKGLSQGKDIDDRNLSLYQVDMLQLTSWLEEEESKGTRWACYLKAQGLKYGVLGFKKDQEAAIAFIKEHNVPY
jgi:TPR repeat protein